RGSVFAKVADGTEDSTSVNFVTSATEEGSAQVYRIKAGDWYGSISGVEVANSGDPGATTTTPNPPSLNPGGWGAENTLWIAYGAGSSYTAVNSYPTNYSSGAHNLSNTGTAGASASSTWREANAASEDPGNFTMSTNSDGVAFTIAIRPVAFGLTGANKVVQTAVYSQPQVAQYSRLIDTDTNVFPTKWLMNGLDNSIGAKWQAMYKSAYDASNVINHQSFDDGTNGVVVTEGNSSYDNCFEAGSATLKYSNAQYVTPGLSARLEVPTGNGTAACQDDHTATTVRYDRFYVRFDSFASLSGLMSLIEYYNTSNSTNVADVRVSTTGELRMRDNFITEATSAALAANTWHRIETSVSNDQLTLRTFEGANLNGITPTQAFTINLNGSPTNNFNRSTVGIVSNISANWGMYIDEHKVSSSNWVGPAYPGWGQTTNFGDVTLGQPENYIPLDASGADTEFARWYFFSINIDASRTFGYPEDVNRGPTISDLSLFFTADPSKRLRHGKTFTGGEQQPLDTPFP
nr:hypothetical protein [Candidatus Saccharibacteria bacterium]